MLAGLLLGSLPPSLPAGPRRAVRGIKPLGHKENNKPASSRSRVVWCWLRPSLPTSKVEGMNLLSTYRSMRSSYLVLASSTHSTEYENST